MKSFIIALVTISLSLMLSSFVLAQAKSSPAVDFTAIDINDNEVNLFETLDAGKTVMLFFFSNSCIHCHAQAPIIDSVYRQFGSGQNELVVWGFADENTNYDEILEFIDSTNITFPCFGTSHETNLFDLYDISYTPQAFIICDYLMSESISFFEIVENLSYCMATPIIEESVNQQFIQIDNGIIRIESELLINNVEIYDITGRSIYYNRFESNSISVLQNLESNQLYIININFKDGSRHSEKLFLK